MELTQLLESASGTTIIYIQLQAYTMCLSVLRSCNELYKVDTCTMYIVSM